MFRFSLQTVLDVRERFERIKYKEYSAELMTGQHLEAELDAHRRSLQRAADYADRARASAPHTLPLELHQHFRQRLLGEMSVLQERLREQQQVVEVKRRELVEARRSHRALEILRDKEYERYRQAEARRERAIMDEIASNYHVFRQ